MAGQVNPMPPFPTRDVFHVALIGRYDSQMTVSNFHYMGEKSIGGSGDADMASLTAALIKTGGLVLTYADCCVTAWVGVELRVDILTMPEVVTMVTSLVPLQGTQPLPGLPTHTAVTIARQANIRGKHGIGRISVPAVPFADVNGSILPSNGRYESLRARMFEVQSDPNHSFQPGIWARKKIPNTTPPQYDFGFSPLISTIVRPLLGTCRRRKPGHGK
jgi:hypothetical protein